MVGSRHYAHTRVSALFGVTARGQAWRRARFAALIAACAVLGATVERPAYAETPANPVRAAQTGEGVRASEPRFEVEASRTRFRLRLSAPVTVSGFVLADPDRVVIDLPDVAFDIPPRLAREAGGLIQSWRGGLFAPGRARLVMDLAAPARLAAATTERDPATGVTVLVIDLVPVPRAEFVQLASARPPTGATATAAAGRAATAVPEPAIITKSDRDKPTAARPSDLPVVVIDPGHGGIDAGTWSRFSDLQEKDLVLAIGLMLRDRLRATRRYQVVMTRETDVFIPLDERVRIARAARADLFLSLHADAEDVSSVRGATVYTLSERASDQRAADLAAKENRADTLAGLDATAATDEVTDILIDLTRRETMQLSAHAARRVLDELRAGDKAIRSNPHRFAGFRVLKAHDVPSLLIETGFMTNRDDVQRMATQEWRAQITDSLSRAIDQFFGQRAPSEAAVAPRR